MIDTSPEYAGALGKHCSNLNVRRGSNGEYPFVDVRYFWKMCNNNAFDILLNEKAKFFSWTHKSEKNKTIDSPQFPLNGITLESGSCTEQDTIKSLDTQHRHNMAAQLEGFVIADDGITTKDPKTG